MIRYLRISSLLFVFFLWIQSLFPFHIEKSEPPSWFSEMVHDTITILLYGENLDEIKEIGSSPELEMLQFRVHTNTNFLSVIIRIKKAGAAYLIFHDQNGAEIRHPFPINEREAYQRPTFSSADVIYLLMPDRFADGDPNNNTIAGHADNTDPNHKWGRRGGDLRGIIDNLPYLKELGITALWLTPVFENDYPHAYHGYTPTDLYAFEPHLGTAEDYRELIALLHKNEIKIIKDHIVNHISPSHPIAQNPPEPDWINGSVDDHLPCDYQIHHVSDPHTPNEKRNQTIGGWFANYLADMNLANADVVNYYILQTIWWIETFKLDGIRQDTFPYSDQEGLKKWIAGLRREYGDIFILGEIMTESIPTLSWFFPKYDSPKHIPSSVTDFPLAKSIKMTVGGKMGVNDFYHHLAADHLFHNAYMLTIFLDNHDMGRFASETANRKQYLNAFTLLFGLRGIPKLYYGNEFAMPGGHDPDNRREMPGGFDHHFYSILNPASRSKSDGHYLTDFKAAIQHRKTHPNLYNAPFYHLIFNENTYLAYRINKNQMLLTVYNQGKDQTEIHLNEIVKGKIITQQKIMPAEAKGSLDIKRKTLRIPKEQAMIYFLEIEP
jgi:neopullulanase